jgi:hypothetical protein
MPRIARKPLTKHAIESASATGKLCRLRDNNPNGLARRASTSSRSGAKSCSTIVRSDKGERKAA